MSRRYRFRPQIFTAMLLLGAVAIIGMLSDMVEVATGCIGGIIALGMKLLEAE